MKRRTVLFFSYGEKLDIDEYRRLSEPPPTNAKLLETIYNCEFLGFVDRERRRVGCLLHPSVRRGKDGRDRSFYGAELCANHFCPSFAHLTMIEQAAVIAALDDWYLYGLVITDIDFIKEFFKDVQNRLGESLGLERLRDPGVQNALSDFFHLKESWKFSSAKDRLGKYYFSQSEYQIARIDYEKNWKMKPSRFDKILVSLSSEFTTRDEILEAEAMIEEKIRKFIEVYERRSPFSICHPP